MNKFLKKLLKEKYEGLAGLEMDIDYFTEKLSECGDEDTLREQLKNEKDKDGKDRDIEYIGEIETKINKIATLTQALNQNKALRDELIDYINYIKRNRVSLIDKYNKYF